MGTPVHDQYFPVIISRDLQLINWDMVQRTTSRVGALVVLVCMAATAAFGQSESSQVTQSVVVLTHTTSMSLYIYYTIYTTLYTRYDIVLSAAACTSADRSCRLTLYHNLVNNLSSHKLAIESLCLISALNHYVSSVPQLCLISALNGTSTG